MMNIKRAKDPQIIKYLRPYFIEDDACTRDIIAKELFDMMVSVPNEIFVVVIFEENELKGFGIAWIPDNREYVWLSQAWSKSGNERKYGREAIEMIKQWAISEHNIHEIRMETLRNPKVMERIWNFKPYAVVMRNRF